MGEITDEVREAGSKRDKPDAAGGSGNLPGRYVPEADSNNREEIFVQVRYTRCGPGAYSPLRRLPAGEEDCKDETCCSRPSDSSGSSGSSWAIPW